MMILSAVGTLRRFVHGCALMCCTWAGGATTGAAENLTPPAVSSPAQIAFQRDVAPILERRCLECHGDDGPKGGLSLASSKSAFTGGDSGPTIVPGKPDESSLLDYVTPGADGKAEMPKGREPLSAAQVETLRRWIAAGAAWPDDVKLCDKRFEGYRRWSLEPLVRPVIPAVKSVLQDAVGNPIDAFILAKLREKNLNPSPEADPATLCRRLYFDLLGLPPTPLEIEEFVRTYPGGYGSVVDKLLASPHYGERWARHWLDVVHFGETHGYDKDKPRPNAWPYRDYVIRTLNDDKPYARFVEEQIAGDVLYPGTRDGIEGLGFIAAGPWDYIGHAEVPETKTDGKVARHLDRDDMITNAVQTFNSLTIQCAQCHDHKFDPILQEDYYSLQAVFAAVDRTDKKYDADPAVARRRAELQEEQTKIARRHTEIEEAVAARAGDELKRLDAQIAARRQPQPGKPQKTDAYGYHSAIAPNADAVKWVQVDLGRPTPIASIVLHPCRDSFNNIGDGFGFPVCYKVEIGDDVEFKNGTVTVADYTSRDVPNPGIQAQAIAVNGQPARYVRVTATKTAQRQNDYIFALSELTVLDGDGKNAAAGATVSSLDSIETPPRWKRTNLVDGYYPGMGLNDPDKLAPLIERRSDILASSATSAQQAELATWEKRKAAVAADLNKLPPQSTAYIGAVHTGNGNFRGTGNEGGKPRLIFLLVRGNVTTPGKEVGPGALSCITTLRSRFELPRDSDEGARRAALARWITDKNNPLTWRSIVNRVWQYHFGRGIVDTPNDFGRNGARPTHPELLDWLAAEFRDGGGSLKRLHRLIVTSATYRQASANVVHNESIDIDNRYLWRINRRRLDAESIRDSLLAISGMLDRAMYGPSFQDFVIEKPQHSPHYEYRLHDPEDPKSHRRSIYRFIVRSQPQPFLMTFDCADPSMQVDKRNESISPLQALTLLNDGLTIVAAKHFAAKLDARERSTAEQIADAFFETTGRRSSVEERRILVAYADKYGLPAVCRVLFNLNEFMFVD